MIDVTEQVLADAPPHGRRRSATVTGTRRSQEQRRGYQEIAQHPADFQRSQDHPYDQVEWERRTAEITDDAGKVVFKQENVEVPKAWSLLATKVVVSKYFYGEQGTPERETSVRQLVHRICRTIADWGIKDGYFTKTDGEVFCDELTWLCLNQYGAFNSPVWFNVGLVPPVSRRQLLQPRQLVLRSQDRPGGAGEDAVRIPAMQRLLHPVGAGQHGVHHAARAKRGDAVQVRLRHGHRSFPHPLEQREA